MDKILYYNKNKLENTFLINQKQEVAENIAASDGLSKLRYFDVYAIRSVTTNNIIIGIR